MLAGSTKEDAVERDQAKLDERERDRAGTPGEHIFARVVAHSRAAIPQQTEPAVARHRPTDRDEAFVAGQMFAFAVIVVEMRLELFSELDNEPRECSFGMGGIDGRVANAVEMLVC